MSFRYKDNSRDDGQMNPNKIELGEPRTFNMEGEKSVREDNEDNRFPKFDSNRGRRPPFGRGRRPSPGRDKPYGDRSRDFGGFNRDDGRDRSPVRSSMDDRFSDRFKKDDSGFNKRDDMGRKDGRSFYGDDNYRDRYPEGRSRFDGPGNFNPRFDSRESQFKSKSLNYPNLPPKGFHNEGFPKPNECEIIVVNKQQRMYAESVESRVKNLGVLVDILFLKDEALLTQTIDDIARRGSLFAMVISPQNETHGSVTVNILHGTPQEHRNMPLDDALKLVSRNFHDHVRTQQESMERERAERGPYVGAVPADRDMQMLLRMLADGRWVSQTELDSVVRYLKERRDKMANSQGDRTPTSQPGDIKLDSPLGPKSDTNAAQKEQDLQNRIINLMSQGAPDGNTDIKSSEPGLGSSQTNLGAIMAGSRSSQPQLGSNMRPSQTPLGPSAIGVSPNQSSLRPMQPGIDDNQSNLAGVGRKQAGTPTNLAGKAGSGLPNEPASSATYLNFDYPSVQKALDNLMQTDPNLLKNITLSNAASSTTKPPGSLLSSMGEPQSPLGGLEASSGSRPGMGSRGPAMPDMGGMPPSRGGMADLGMGAGGSGGRMDMGGMGSQRGPGNLQDMGGMGPHRGPPDMGSQRGPGAMPDMGQRGPGMGNMGPPRGSGGMADMGGMGPQRGGNMVPPQGMAHGPPNMGHGSNFPAPNQPSYPAPNLQGNFPGSMPYNSGSSNMMNMPRQSYGGGNQGPVMGSGMGGAPRRY